MNSSLFTPYKLGPVTLRNRTIRSAAFESMGKDFGPTQQLKDYHVSVARGGIGMTTLAYAAVCRSGLSFDKQLWLRPEIVPGLRGITDAVHREGAAAGIQIGHCGNMTHLTTAGQIPIGAFAECTLPLDEEAVIVDDRTPEATLERREQAVRVRMALLSLNPVDREVFLRFYYYYQKTADIAADMGLNESTVRTKLNRGRAKLRDFLLREDNHDETEKGGAAWNTISMI